jgi:hypothetical protein
MAMEDRQQEYEIEVRVFQRTDAVDTLEHPIEIEIHKSAVTLKSDESIYDVFMEQAHDADNALEQYELELDSDVDPTDPEPVLG